MPTLELPEIPAPVAVSLEPRASVLLLFDLSDALCGAVPSCVETLPRILALLRSARGAGVPVVFTLGRAPQRLLPELDARPSEGVVRSGADKFFRTDLDARVAGRATAVLAGTSSNGSIVYTALACCARGMRVVVAEDAISSRVPFANTLARWQLLNQPGYPNRENLPLAPSTVTLSRTNLIAFTE